MKIQETPIEKIKIGKRYRQEWGDLDGLAANIREIGLLQPIGIDQYCNLVFGARRLRAVSYILEWKTIPCRIVNLASLLAGEFSENEFRKQFTASERVAIGAAIEAELGNRQSQGRPKVSANAETYPKGNTVDIAAKKAGFASAESFERAKTVIERGAPEVIAAMDAGDLSISAAATISTQPEKDQKQIIEMPVEERKEVLRQIRKTKADREADERVARDVRLFRGLNEAVKFIAHFTESTKETWAGLQRVSAYQFSEFLDPALECLKRLKQEHPNAEKTSTLTKTGSPRPQRTA